MREVTIWVVCICCLGMRAANSYQKTWMPESGVPGGLAMDGKLRRRSERSLARTVEGLRHSIGVLVVVLFLLDGVSPAISSERPVDPTKLRNIQQKLEQYYSRVSAMRVVYVHSVVSSTAPEATTLAGAMRTELIYRVADGAFRRSRAKTGNGAKESGSNADIVYYQAGKKVALSHAQKHATIESVGDVSAMETSTPFRAIGMPLLGMKHVMLSELLRDPAVVHDLGDDAIRGIDATVLKIGPGMPMSLNAGNPGWPDRWIKVWLAKQLNFFPIRMEIYDKVPDGRTESFYKEKGVAVTIAPDATGASVSYYALRAEILEIREAPDRLRGTTMVVPWKVEVASGAIVRTTCEAVEINPLLPTDIFEASIPNDFSIIRDKKMVRLVPNGERRRKSPDSAAVAEKRNKDVLSTPVPTVARSTVTSQGWLFPLLIMLFGLAVSISVFTMLRKRRHV
jgi:hypothetical protein